MPECIEDGQPGQIEIRQCAKVNKKGIHDLIDRAQCTIPQDGVEGKEQTRKDCALKKQRAERGRERDTMIFCSLVRSSLCTRDVMNVALSVPRTEGFYGTLMFCVSQFILYISAS